VTVTVYIDGVDERGRRYSIDELADLVGVSRRTVRFYVQEGLLPVPLGVGRGSHYDQSHLDRLLEVRLLQESGRSLEDIRAGRTPAQGPGRQAAVRSRAVPRSAWRRLELAPGVELHVASDVRLPPGPRLEELVEWCQRHMVRNSEDKE
jgi:DNA-binding transcriptional MerR regulator